MAYNTYLPGGYNPYPPGVYGPRMETPQPNMQQPPQSQQPASQQIALSAASRPVTNRDEANAVPADFSGALMLFPDITHNRVYVKRWDYTAGGPSFVEYAPVIPEPPRPETPAVWATLEDMQTMQDAVEQLKAEIDRLKRAPGKAGRKNDADE